MRPLLPAALVLLPLLGCDSKLNPTQRGVDTNVVGEGGGVVGPGWLEVEGGARCVVDDGELVGFCGEADATFWADASTELAEADCAQALSATVWMSAASWSSGEHALVADNDGLDASQASVWFDLEGETFVSEGGTATATEVGTDSVRVDFETTGTVDFLTRETAGPVVRGQVWCTRSGDR